ELNQSYIAGLLLRRFLFIFALTLLFDIRDFRKDRLARTLTFPGHFGTVFTKVLAVVALFLFVVLVHFQETGPVQVALYASAAAAGLVVYFSREDRPDAYFSVFADGMMLLQFLLVWVSMRWF
ncbi:MAG TPA: hypothetical protein VK927_03575, partial [Adhaeribacter sp.]|nr:hypothetical protein [Adhaeribacter sp.]